VVDGLQELVLGFEFHQIDRVVSGLWGSNFALSN